jgi:ABC-type Fe3+/spermidine/putrescine transport system ATPase subunit
LEQKDTYIKIENVTKAFGSFKAVDSISLDIPRGSFTTLLGPSGCGKTTLMRLIAGFYECDGGSIFIEGKKVNGLPPYKRNTPLVFQEYALFPHMTVYENIAYGLKLRSTPSFEIKQKVLFMLSVFKLEGMENRFPKQLSGGQQQRVAFARALILGQKILLLDEPLSNLDAKLRVDVRNELRDIQRQFGITIIYVTHDQDEALSMSDTIAVIRKGCVSQVGTPWEIYFKPNNRFVADFVGTVNFIDADVIGEEADEIIVKYMDKPIRLDKSNYSVVKGEKVTVVLRPECIALGDKDDSRLDAENTVRGKIKKRSFLGHIIRYWVEVGDRQFIVDDSNPSLRGFLEGEVNIIFDKKKIHLLKDVS